MNFSDRDFPALPSKDEISTQHKDVYTGEVDRQNCYATLNELPTELILDILYHLPGINVKKGNLRSLLALSVTSKRLHLLVAEQLYATFHGKYCDPYLFLRALCANPSLAVLVKHVNLVYVWQKLGYRTNYRACAQDKKIIKEGMKSTGVASWKQWATECNSWPTQLDTLYSAIVLQAPNVISLDFDHVSDEKTPRWINLNLFKGERDRMHRECGSKLERMTIDCADTESLNSISPIFRIPSLQQLHLASFRVPDIDIEQTMETLQRLIPKSCNNITELRLEYCSVQIEFLSVLVESSRCLEALRYRATSDDSRKVLRMAKMNLVSVIECQKTSLRILEMWPPLNFEEHFNGVISDSSGLRNFQALEELACPLCMLAGRNEYEYTTLPERLPPSLKSLHTSMRREKSEKDRLAALERLATGCSEYTPLLKFVSIKVFGAYPRIKYDWAHLLTLFSQAGVQFVIDSKDKADGTSLRWNREDVEMSDSSSWASWDSI